MAPHAARESRAARLNSGLSFLPDGRIDSTPGGLRGPPGTFVFWRVLREPSADGAAPHESRDFTAGERSRRVLDARRHSESIWRNGITTRFWASRRMRATTKSRRHIASLR
ncbi:hypothetical protein BLAT2472_90204 [Burkholderia latens]